jgi:hypothetical protein
VRNGKRRGKKGRSMKAEGGKGAVWNYTLLGASGSLSFASSCSTPVDNSVDLIVLRPSMIAFDSLEE